MHTQAVNQTVFKVGAGANTTAGSALSGGTPVVSIEATDSGSASTPGLRVAGRGDGIIVESENGSGITATGGSTPTRNSGVSHLNP